MSARWRSTGHAAPATPDATARWALLDDPAEWQGFSRPVPAQAGAGAGDEVFESYLSIEGMHCAACTLTVEQALMAAPGVRSVQVNGTSATARVVWTPAAGLPSGWLHALQRAGYGGLPAADMLSAGAARRQAQRVLLWRWLVAGFCMMQVMMYAVPTYMAEPGDITPDILALLRWASWILTLPVMVFSCTPFFRSAWRDVRMRRIGMDVPVALGLLIAFGASTAATFDPSGPWGAEVWYDSVTMFVFFLLSGRLLEARLRDRTAGALEALMRRLPDRVLRETANGGTEPVPVRRLAVGDVIHVLAGEAIPADGEVIEGESQVDEALLTGESTPLQRGPGAHVVAGSHNLSGLLRVRVSRVGADTRFAQIVALMEQASVDKPRLAQLADRMATPFLAAVLLAAAGAAAWWWSAGPAHALSVAVAVLIVTCPCALSLATPAATLAAAGALARRGVLVRRLQGLEAAAAVDTVVFDKTGTLTQDAMRVVAVQPRDGVSADHALALAAALARHSLHPASRAIQASAIGPGSAVTGVHEAPGQGVTGVVHTGTETHTLRLGSAAYCRAPEQAQGFQVHLADGAGWLAGFTLDEALRPDAVSAVTQLQALGLRSELLSGDREASARSVAARAGIAEARGGQSPEDKLDHVSALQDSGHRVLMVGDGMNDGPVLARADASIAIGQAVPLAQARADFIVMGARLSAVSTLVATARRTRRVVQENLAWAALYNGVSVPLAVAGLMPPWLAGLGMAGSSLLVVLNSARLARVPGEA